MVEQFTIFPVVMFEYTPGPVMFSHVWLHLGELQFGYLAQFKK